MKKLIAALCTVAVLGGAAVAVVVSADKNETESVSSDGIASRENVGKTVDATLIDGTSGKLTYSMSRELKYGFMDVYTAENGDEYHFRDGRLSGFFSSGADADTADAEPIGESAASEIARKALAPFADGMDAYALSSVEDQNRQYYVTYRRTVGGVPTDEYAEAWVMYDGSVQAVTTDNIGVYANVPASVVDGVTDEVIADFVKSEMALIYPGQDADYEMKEYYLSSDADGYFIRITGDVTVDGGYPQLHWLRYGLGDAVTAAVKEGVFPARPDRIVIGSGGGQKEILPGDEAFERIFAALAKRVERGDGLGALRLMAYDPSTKEHLSVGLRESAVFAEFVYDGNVSQVVSQHFNEGREADTARLFFPLTGQYHGYFFLSANAQYEGAATLATLPDDTSLITYITGITGEKK